MEDLQESQVGTSRLLVIGASSGGLQAMKTILKALPGNLPMAIAMVQHRKRGKESNLPELLRKECEIPVVEVEDKDPILPGRVHVAPADYHLLVDDRCFSLSTDPPVNYARPSIDVLFDSAAGAWGPRVIGVILTGANSDGAAGLASVKNHGGLTVVQDPATAEAPAMPQAAIAATQVDFILPLEEIGRLLAELGVRGKL